MSYPLPASIPSFLGLEFDLPSVLSSSCLSRCLAPYAYYHSESIYYMCLVYSFIGYTMLYLSYNEEPGHGILTTVEDLTLEHKHMNFRR